MATIADDHSARCSSLCPPLENFENFIRDSPHQVADVLQKSPGNGHRRRSCEFFRENFLYFTCKMSETLRIFNSLAKSLPAKLATTRISPGIGLFKTIFISTSKISINRL